MIFSRIFVKNYDDRQFPVSADSDVKCVDLQGPDTLESGRVSDGGNVAH